jgi:4-diphosphocytidyl-2-C-methyl-D-erythritol kinase
MRTYILQAAAKINLYLEIVGDRPDGYHELVMVMQSIDLTDRLELYPNGLQTYRLSCENPEVPCDSSNLALKAALLMEKTYPSAFANYGGVDIVIEKRIPVAAGLAGGSANAAAVLVGLDLIWKLGLTLPEIQSLAAQLGSDIPFCVAGGTAIATGRGEKLAPLPDLDNLWVVLGKYSHLAVSTPWAYQTYRQHFAHTYRQDIAARAAQIHAGPLVQSIQHKDPDKIGRLLHNDLEKIVLGAYPQVAQLRETMQQAGGVGTMMSGSGPTVFTLCRSHAEATEVLQKTRTSLNDSQLGLWLAPLSTQGVSLIQGF